MAEFVSDISGVPLVDDVNWRDFAVPMRADGSSATGYVPRDLRTHPKGYASGVPPFPRELLIPRSEWKDRIEEMERTKTRLSDLIRVADVEGKTKWLNQSPTNYCWCFAVAHAVMILRLFANQPFVRLSPFSVAGPIKNYQNNGGWGTEAVQYMVEHGIAAEEFWPQGKLDGQNDSANMQAIRNGRQFFEGSRDNAARHKIGGTWYDCSGDFDEKMAMLLRRIPVPSGYSWQGHETCSIDPVYLGSNQFGCLDMDSYTRDGKLDAYARTESRGTGEDQSAVFVTAASAI